MKFEVPFEGEEREEREDGRRKRLSFPAMMWRIKTGGGGGSSWMSSGGEKAKVCAERATLLQRGLLDTIMPAAARKQMTRSAWQ